MQAEGEGGTAAHRKPRVLIVSDHLGHEGGAIHGVTTYYANILPRLDPDRVEVAICFLRGPHPAVDRLRAEGIEPIFFNRSKWDPRALIDLYRLVRRKGIDVLHIAGVKTILLGRLAGRFAGCANLMHLHDTQPLSLLMRGLQTRLAPWTDLALGCSEVVREQAVRAFGVPPDRTRTLHYGLPLDRFANPAPDARRRIRRELNIPEDAPVVGMVGRFHRMKGHPHLIKAMPLIRAVCPGAVALLVGDGVARTECEHLVRRSGLTDAVRFVGHRDDIPDMLAAFDALAMPSLYWEGLPYAAIEAAAAGLPVVAYRTPGVDEVVLDGETGLLVESRDVEGLADAIARVLSDPELADRLGSRARRRAQQFSIERHVEELMRIYERLADCARGSERPAPRRKPNTVTN